MIQLRIISKIDKQAPLSARTYGSTRSSKKSQFVFPRLVLDPDERNDQGSTAKLGDEGHSATLTSDGLCSVGPLMERGSGSYHAEFMIKQVNSSTSTQRNADPALV